MYVSDSAKEQLAFVERLCQERIKSAKEHLKTMERALDLATQITNDKDAIEGLLNEIEAERKAIDSCKFGIEVLRGHYNVKE